MWSPAAHVAADAYCERVTARADSASALLWGPKLTVQGLRYPSGFDLGPATGSGLQLRLGVAYSLIDPIRALRVSAAAEADCAAEQTRTQLTAALAATASAPETHALRAQAAFLQAHQAQVDGAVERARTRVIQRVISVFELSQILDAAELLERKAVQARGAAERRQAREGSPGDATMLAEALVRRRAAHEERLSSVQTLDAWNLRLQGGVIPVEGVKLDWFGWLELSYDLGGPLQSAAEARYRTARHAELSEDVSAQLEQRARERSAHAAQLSSELRIIEKRLSHLRATIAELDASDASGTSHARDALGLAQLSADAERIYLESFLEALGQTERGS